MHNRFTQKTIEAGDDMNAIKTLFRDSRAGFEAGAWDGAVFANANQGDELILTTMKELAINARDQAINSYSHWGTYADGFAFAMISAIDKIKSSI